MLTHEFVSPAAILRVWSGQKGTLPSLAEAELFSLTHRRPDAHVLAPGMVGFTAEGGNPAIFDAALELGGVLRSNLAPIEPESRILILPGSLRVRGAELELIADDLLEDAAATFAEIPAGEVLLTSWAANSLELFRPLTEVCVCVDSAGRSIPVFRPATRGVDELPWRNPELLNRRLQPVARDLIAGSDAKELLSHAAVRIQGPLGCGKSHFAHHFLASNHTPRLWVRSWASIGRERSLAGRLISALVQSLDLDGTPPIPVSRQALSWACALEGRIRDSAYAASLSEVVDRLFSSLRQTAVLVIDDLHLATPADQEDLAGLLELSGLGNHLRLLFLGRHHARLSDALESLPCLHIPPFNQREMREFSSGLFEGLSVPAAVSERLLAETEGYPFALEEGLVAQIRRRNLRRLYGSFFFAGREGVRFNPSPRLLCHLQAEAYRLGAALPLHILAASRTAVPVEGIDDVLARSGATEYTEWRRRAAEGGLLAAASSPWGDAISFACPAFAKTLAAGMNESFHHELRNFLGEALLLRSQSGESYWYAYQHLEGTEQASEALRQVIDSDFATQISPEDLLSALRQELAEQRARGGSEDEELAMLWRALPLARRFGRLGEFSSDLDRAVEIARADPKRLLALAGLKAELAQEAGRFEEAESTIRLALAAAQGADERRQALLLMQLGRLQLDQEKTQEARALYQKLAANLDSHQMQPLAASCRYYLGNIALQEESYEESRRWHLEALESRRQLGLHRAAGNSLTALGSVSLASGNLPQAIHCFAEALDLLTRHGKPFDRAFPLLGLGRAHTQLGDYSAASKSLREALEIRSGRDDRAGEAVARLALAENQLHLGQLEQANADATEALFQLNLLSRRHLIADAEQLLGRIQSCQRQHEVAKRQILAALEKHAQKGNSRAVARDHAYLLEIALATGSSQDISREAASLRGALDKIGHPELAEDLQYLLSRGLTWLRNHGDATADPLPSLELAYRELLRKAAHLDPQQRHHFLFQIAAHADIVAAATRAGIQA